MRSVLNAAPPLEKRVLTWFTPCNAFRPRFQPTPITQSTLAYGSSVPSPPSSPLLLEFELAGYHQREDAFTQWQRDIAHKLSLSEPRVMERGCQVEVL